MIRLIGAALVAGGCGWLGFRAAEGLRLRVKALGQMAAGLALLERELELTAPPLERLLARGGEQSRGPAREIFLGCARGLDRLGEEDFSHLWRRLTAEQEELGGEGQALVAPLGDTLGRYDAREQGAAVACVRRRLEELAARRDQDRRRQGRVYQALGLSGGAFLVILLL